MKLSGRTCQEKEPGDPKIRGKYNKNEIRCILCAPEMLGAKTKRKQNPI